MKAEALVAEKETLCRELDEAKRPPVVDWDQQLADDGTLLAVRFVEDKPEVPEASVCGMEHRLVKIEAAIKKLPSRIEDAVLFSKWGCRELHVLGRTLIVA